jgi:uncharacterized membrane protein YkvA (DUF1232 family)
MDVVEVVGLVIVALVALWLVLIVALFLLRPRGVRATELVRLIPDVVRLARDLVLDPKTPRGVRVALVILAAWLISPIDLVPEFIPLLGPVDDAIVTVLVLRYVRRRLGVEALRSRWRGTGDGFRTLEAILGR